MSTNFPQNFFQFFTQIFFFYSLISINSINSMEGIDLFQLTTLDDFNCLKEKLSAKFVIIRGGRSVGLVDSNLIKNIKNARGGGFEDVDIYIFPCVKPELIKNINKNVTCGNARETITSVLNELNCNNLKIGRVWLDIEGEPGENNKNQTYYWYEDKEKNIEFIDGMINILNENNQLFGIYASKYFWTKITGNEQKYSSQQKTFLCGMPIMME
ncbi:unnamed protein product [Meloidogyne enterolobii]|uniref:Uncharacterized protein n=1 Tax=Meloidogyne enterolobii TaxID=390850 RepID=A0ACB0Z4T5_MELEN